MIYIPLNRGLYALVDREDYEKVGYYTWYCHRGYVVRTQKVNGKKKMLYMHREILRPPAHLVVDHINGNKLDNRRSNLRVCTRGENVRNMRQTMTRKRADKHSKYKGVYWVKGTKKWAAQIRVNKRQLHLGYFEREEDAAAAYDQAAQQYFGEFACINNPTKGDRAWSTDTKELLNPFSPAPNGRILDKATI